MEFNGDPPQPMTYEDTWEGNRYVPINIGQQCHISNFIGYVEGGRAACPETATVLIGMYFGGHHLGFCPKHWAQFRDIIAAEMRSRPSDEHWLVQLAIEHLGEWVQQGAVEERERLKSRERDEFWRPRRMTTTDRALADGLTDGQRVYFIQAGKRGPIKIGVAKDVRKRFDALQTASPYRLHVRATIPGDERTEAAYHRMFEAHRLSGEWFKPVAAVLAEIKAINAVKRRGEGALF